MSSFDDFNLLPSLSETLRENGLVTPTEIQGLAIPRLLRGESLVGLLRRVAERRLRMSYPFCIY